MKPAITARPDPGEDMDSGREWRKTSPNKPPALRALADFKRIEREGLVVEDIEFGKRRRIKVGRDDMKAT